MGRLFVIVLLVIIILISVYYFGWSPMLLIPIGVSAAVLVATGISADAGNSVKLYSKLRQDLPYTLIKTGSQKYAPQIEEMSKCLEARKGSDNAGAVAAVRDVMRRLVATDCRSNTELPAVGNAGAQFDELLRTKHLDKSLDEKISSTVNLLTCTYNMVAAPRSESSPQFATVSESPAVADAEMPTFEQSPAPVTGGSSDKFVEKVFEQVLSCETLNATGDSALDNRVNKMISELSGAFAGELRTEVAGNDFYRFVLSTVYVDFVEVTQIMYNKLYVYYLSKVADIGTLNVSVEHMAERLKKYEAEFSKKLQRMFSGKDTSEPRVNSYRKMHKVIAAIHRARIMAVSLVNKIYAKFIHLGITMDKEVEAAKSQLIAAVDTGSIKKHISELHDVVDKQVSEISESKRGGMIMGGVNESEMLNKVITHLQYLKNIKNHIQLNLDLINYFKDFKTNNNNNLGDIYIYLQNTDTLCYICKLYKIDIPSELNDKLSTVKRAYDLQRSAVFPTRFNDTEAFALLDKSIKKLVTGIELYFSSKGATLANLSELPSDEDINNEINSIKHLSESLNTSQAKLLFIEAFSKSIQTSIDTELNYITTNNIDIKGPEYAERYDKFLERTLKEVNTFVVDHILPRGSNTSLLTNISRIFKSTSSDETLASLQTYKDQITAYSEDLKKAKADNSKLSNTNSALLQQVTNSVDVSQRIPDLENPKVQQLTAENVRLTTDLDTQLKRVEDLTARVLDFESNKEFKKIKIRQSATTAFNETLQAKRAELQQENKELLRQLNLQSTSEDQKKVLQAHIQSITDRIATLKDEVFTGQQTVEELKKVFEQTSEQTKKLKQQTSARTATVSELTEQLQTADIAVSTLEASVRLQTNRQAELQREKLDLSESINKLQQEKVNLTKSVNELNVEVGPKSNIENKLKTKKAKLTEIEGQITNINTNIKKQTKVINDNEQKIQRQKAELKLLRQTIDTNATLAQIEGNKSTQPQAEALVESINATKAIRDDLANALNNAQSQSVNLQQDVSTSTSIENTSVKLQKYLSTIATTENGLQDQVKHLQTLINTQNAELKTLRADYERVNGIITKIFTKTDHPRSIPLILSESISIDQMYNLIESHIIEEYKKSESFKETESFKSSEEFKQMENELDYYDNIRDNITNIDKLKEIRESVPKTNSDILAFISAVIKLHESPKDNTDTINQLTQQLNILVLANDNLRILTDTQHKEITNNNTQISEFEDQNKELTEKQKNTHRELLGLQSKIRILENTINTQQGALGIPSNSMQQLLIEKQQLETEIQRLRNSALASLPDVSEINQLKQTIINLKQQIHNQANTAQSASTKHNSLDAHMINIINGYIGMPNLLTDPNIRDIIRVYMTNNPIMIPRDSLYFAEQKK